MYMKTIFMGAALLLTLPVAAQQKEERSDVVSISNAHCRVVANLVTGKLDYLFASGTSFQNSICYVEDRISGRLSTTDFNKHSYTIDEIEDPLGKGLCLNLEHDSETQPLRLTVHVTLYERSPYVLVSTEATAKDKNALIETRDISPLTVLPAQEGRIVMQGKDAMFTDYPFDNDNWVDVISRHWPDNNQSISGTSYELASAYDKVTRNGWVTGSLLHDFWKTGIRYGSGTTAGHIDSLVVFGGAATKDDHAVPASFGGLDGTHDVVPHGTQLGNTVYSPLIYLSASADVRNDLVIYGKTVGQISGSRSWKQNAPFYWNSFGVEGVLGYEKILMPRDMVTISDFIQSLDHFNASTKPVLSIDSYDQDIYSTEVLKSIDRYGKKKGQQMGFYFIPFALWTWKNGISEAMLTGTRHPLRDVILMDDKGSYVPYKDGDWGAFPLDPTHPATRDYIVGQLKKAKAIDARFIKIDFLSAGALESARRFDPAVRSGKQAYNYGMKMLRELVDSILGSDIFITQAISPLFPSQYAHTRFLSTDVYSHLRNDQPGFPHYGSTSSSMISASHFWWVQGTLWPYTNMDVVVMKNFQKNKELTETEVKVRLYSMLALGSIFGDGTDFRNKTAAERARKFLDHPAICSLFSHPRAFTPLRFPEGNGQSQQMSFYLPGDTILVSAFNFDASKEFTEKFLHRDLGCKQQEYRMKDLFTGREIGRIKKGQSFFEVTVPMRDAVMIALEPVSHN